MRVLIDATYARRRPDSGTGVYLAKVTEALSELDGVQVIEVANFARRQPAGGGLGSLRNALVDEHWLNVELPRRARYARADVIHHPLPARCRTVRIPQVITVHDLAFARIPDAFAASFRRYASFAHRDAARHADAVVCVSSATAGDVATLWGVSGRRIVIARHGPGQDLPARERRDPSHFLYVGDEEPRKNLSLLIEAFGRYRAAATGTSLDLVLAGPISTVAAGSGIRLERDPTPERLADLYAGAAALVHPARYEGFGLTLLEAMKAGTPVIAARIPAVHEVCGDAARYVSPLAAGPLAAAIAALAEHPAARANLAQRGSRQVRAFSWATAAHRHLEAYSLALH
jgi:glycosyltransferase involved in cell wall biosynthesis